MKKEKQTEFDLILEGYEKLLQAEFEYISQKKKCPKQLTETIRILTDVVVEQALQKNPLIKSVIDRYKKQAK